MAVVVSMFFVSVICAMVVETIYTCFGGVGGKVWCRQQWCRSTRVMVVCCCGSLGVRFCYVFCYVVLSTTAVFGVKCKQRVADGGGKWTHIVVGYKRWESRWV